MAITVTNSDSTPALDYNRFFLVGLSLDQKTITDNSVTPYYTLNIQYRMYALDNNGNRHYRNKTNFIRIEDYIAKATEKAATGDMDLVVAMQAIEAALVKIIEDQTDLGTAEVV